MSAAALPLELADAVASALATERPALTIARRLWIALKRDDLATLRVIVAPTGRTAQAAARVADAHEITVELAIAQSLPGPDFDAQAAAVLATALDLAGLWLSNGDDTQGPLRAQHMAGCRYVSQDHSPLLDPDTLARGLAVSVLSLRYAATI